MEQSDFPADSTDYQAKELELVTHLLRVFQNLPPQSRQRVLDTVSRFFDLRPGLGPGGPSHSLPPTSTGADQPSSFASFSEDRSMTPKQFMLQKQPKTDVEKIACLAYYLTHYRDTPHFKTLDLSKLNTEAAQTKFSNPAVATDNATKRSYLVPATRGNKQLSAIGEQFVLALPDREKAQEVMKQVRPRRRTKRDPAES